MMSGWKKGVLRLTETLTMTLGCGRYMIAFILNKVISKASSGKDRDRKSSGIAVAGIIWTLFGKNTMRAIPDFKTAVRVQQKIQLQYASKSMISRLTLADNLHKMEFNFDVYRGGHDAQ